MKINKEIIKALLKCDEFKMSDEQIERRKEGERLIKEVWDAI